MRKIFTLVFAIALSVNMFAQCPLTTAVDFTATDCHGTEVHLFDILDGGQYVLVDFFFANCGPCQQATPKVVQSYYSFGCNMHDVFYVEISDRDSDAVCQNWVNNYGVEYPTIGGPAGGATICNQYQIGAFPTVILIAPDRSIVIQDLWPISNAQTVITQLEAHGIQQYECTPVTENPEVSITVGEIHETEVTVTFTPNETCAIYYYVIATPEELSGLELPEWLQAYGTSETVTVTHTFTGLAPNTEYIVCAVPADADLSLYEMVQESVTTMPSTQVEFSVDVVEFSIGGCIEEPGMFTIYNESATDLLIEDYQSVGFTLILSCSGEDIGCSIMEGPIPSSGSLDVYVYYEGLAKDDELNGTLKLMTSHGDYELPVVITVYDGVEEYNANDFTLYPNPANEFVKISGKNLGNVQIFNMVGQKVEEFEFDDNELNINISSYEDGVYFVKIGGKTQRFVVTH